MFLVFNNNFESQAFELKTNTEVFDNVRLECAKLYQLKNLKTDLKNKILQNLLDNYEVISLYVSHKKEKQDYEKLYYGLYCSVKKETCNKFIKSMMNNYLNYVILDNITNKVYVKFIFEDKKEYNSMYHYLMNLYNIYYRNLKKEKEEDKPKVLKAYKKIQSPSGLKILRPINKI